MKRKSCEEPGKYLSADAVASLDLALASIKRDSRHACGSNAQAGYEIGVAVVPRLGSVHGSGASAARRAAESTFNDWGVGDKACKTGVLLLVAVEDRKVYIKTGRGAKQALTDSKVQAIIAGMKPRLRRKDYDDAVVNAVADMAKALSPTTRVHRSALSLPDTFMRAAFVAASMLSGGIFWLLGASAVHSASRARSMADCRARIDRIERERPASTGGSPLIMAE
eukprot:g3370.t1